MTTSEEIRIESNSETSGQQTTFDSLDALRLEKEKLRNEILKERNDITKEWNALVHPTSITALKRPSSRLAAFASIGGSVFDGLLLGWKLYRKFGKGRKKS